MKVSFGVRIEEGVTSLCPQVLGQVLGKGGEGQPCRPQCHPCLSTYTPSPPNVNLQLLLATDQSSPTSADENSLRPTPPHPWCPRVDPLEGKCFCSCKGRIEHLPHTPWTSASSSVCRDPKGPPSADIPCLRPWSGLELSGPATWRRLRRTMEVALPICGSSHLQDDPQGAKASDGRHGGPSWTR